jgi:hypothetical protein
VVGGKMRGDWCDAGTAWRLGFVTWRINGSDIGRREWRWEGVTVFKVCELSIYD